MDDLRLILLLCGVALIAGIYYWETFRKRARTRHLPELLRDGADEPLAARHPGPSDEAAADSEPEQAVLPGDFDVAGGAEMGEMPPAVSRAEPEAELPAAGLEAVVPRKDDGPTLGSLADLGRRGDELILAVSVMTKTGMRFSGADIAAAMTDLDMHLGDMNIFHRYQPGVKVGRPVFSAANVLEPGSFDPGAMEQTFTPGLLLFARFTGSTEDAANLDAMIEAGRTLAETLDGELRDERRSSLTNQSIVHLRERLSDYRRKKLLEAEKSSRRL